MLENKVKILRKQLNLSQEELALKAQTTRQTIIRIERGERPSFDIAMGISNVLGESVNDIFFGFSVTQELQN